MAEVCFYPMCQASPKNGKALFRVNAKGVPPVWACREHLKNTDAKINGKVLRIVTAIEESQRKGSH